MALSEEDARLRDLYVRKINRILAQAERLDQQQVKDVLFILADARRALVDELTFLLRTGAATEASLATASQARDAIDRAASSFAREFQRDQQEAVQASFERGTVLTPTVVGEMGISLPGTPEVSRAQLVVIQQMQVDLVQAVSQAFRVRTQRSLQLSMLGGKSLTSTLAAVAQDLRTQPQRQSGKLGPIAYQAERIVRTELGRAFAVGQEMQSNALDDVLDGLHKIWRTAGDHRVRDAHVAAGRRYTPGGDPGPIPHSQPFSVGGESLMYPHDPAGSAAQTINCLVGETRVAGRDIEGATRRWYEGMVVSVHLAGGMEITGTPNHPVLTDHGWVALGQLDPRFHCVYCIPQQSMLSTDPNVDNGPTRFEEVYATASGLWQSERITGRGADFHGDGLDGDVDVVSANRQLRLALQMGELTRNLPLPSADVLPRLLMGQGSSLQFPVRANHPSDGIVGGSREGRSLLGSGTLRTQPHLFAGGPNGYPGTNQAVMDRISSDTVIPTDGHLAIPTEVALRDILGVDHLPFTGHVYNLQTASGWYTGNGVIVHNCRCTRLDWHPLWAGTVDEVLA